MMLASGLHPLVFLSTTNHTISSFLVAYVHHSILTRMCIQRLLSSWKSQGLVQVNMLWLVQQVCVNIGVRLSSIFVTSHHLFFRLVCIENMYHERGLLLQHCPL